MSRWGLIDKTLEGRERVFFPHWSRLGIPTDVEANLRYRDRAALTTDPKERRELLRMCREDFLFYLTTFAYIFRADVEGEEEPGPIPFIPYDFQVEMFTVLWSALHEGRREKVRVKKRRRMGVTWMVLLLFEHCWHFMRNRHLLVGSRREEEVEGSAQRFSRNSSTAGEWSRLLPKVDFVHLHQPRWVWPEGYAPRMEPYRQRLKILSPETNSIIWGTSATSGAAQSERGYAFFWDEASLTQNLYDIIGGLSKFSRCGFYVSTIRNLDHPFSTVLRDPPIVQLSPEWWMHPEYGAGMTVDPETGRRTSPCVERECAELGHDPVLCNRHVFADEGLQVGGYYPQSLFERMLGGPNRPGTVMEPFHVGELDVQDGPDGPWVTRFCEQPMNGRWRFWLEFDADGQDNQGRGKSNSVAAVCDATRREIVAELVVRGVPPYQFARMVAAAGRWFEGEDFGPAFVVPERNGPGEEFVRELVHELRYPAVWQEVAAGRTNAGERRYGWTNTPAGGRSVQAFGKHREMLIEGTLVERSAECVEEMRHYQHGGAGLAPVHSAALAADDPTGAKQNHGDRVIARVCVCVKLAQWIVDPPVRTDEPPRGSYADMLARRERRNWRLQRA